MERMRPFWGSTTTTLPLYGPSASTAARRISRSSPSTLSVAVESAYVGSVHGPPAITGAEPVGVIRETGTTGLRVDANATGVRLRRFLVAAVALNPLATKA